MNVTLNKSPTLVLAVPVDGSFAEYIVVSAPTGLDMSSGI